MEPRKAAGHAAAFYRDHSAARSLLRESWHGATPDRRRRSSVALVALDTAASLAVVEAMAVWAGAATGDEVPAAPAGPLDKLARPSARSWWTAS